MSRVGRTLTGMEVLGVRGAGDGLQPYLFSDTTCIRPCEPRRAHVLPRWGVRKPSRDVGATSWTPTIKVGVSRTIRISPRRRSTPTCAVRPGWRDCNEGRASSMHGDQGRNHCGNAPPSSSRRRRRVGRGSLLLQRTYKTLMKSVMFSRSDGRVDAPRAASANLFETTRRKD